MDGRKFLRGESLLPQIEILISPMVYKDKITFLVSHISVMEINEIVIK